MADINNTNRLQNEADKKRKDLLDENRYSYTKDNEYDSKGNSKDALSDGDPLGKGGGILLGVAPRPGETDSKAIRYDYIDTTSDDDGGTHTIGGLYDIEGRPEAGERTGRKKLMLMNLYKPGDGYNYHGQNVIDVPDTGEQYHFDKWHENKKGLK